MKKITIILIVFFCLNHVKSQSPSMAKGKLVIYAGAGAGTGYFGSAKYKGYGYTYRTTPTFHFGFEYGFSEAIPKSVLGIGANISMAFTNQTYRDKFGRGYNVNWNDITVLSRGYYHHTFLVGEKWDVYASPLLGLRFRTYSYSPTDPSYNNYYYSDSGARLAFGVSVGGRIYISKVFGFYAELSQGYNVDYAKIGFAFKF